MADSLLGNVIKLEAGSQGLVFRGPGQGYRLTSECRKWLRCHAGTWSLDWYDDPGPLHQYCEHVGVAVHIRDPKVAMFFKLTWVE